MLGPLLFNLYINDLYYLFSNYADDNTSHVCDTSLSSLMAKIEGEAAKLLSGSGTTECSLILINVICLLVATNMKLCAFSR